MPSSRLPATLHLIDPACWEVAEARLLVTPAELAQADRFVFPADRDRWLKFRAATRRILATHLDADPTGLQWLTGEHGKPYLAGHPLHFNLSHSESLAILIVSESGPVGIDIEPTSRAPTLLGCEEHFCHPGEIFRLPAEPAARAAELLRIWTAKEAVLKALGTGMSQPPQEIEVIDDRCLGHAAGLDRFRLDRPPIPDRTDHLIAIAREIQTPPSIWAQ